MRKWSLTFSSLVALAVVTLGIVFAIPANSAMAFSSDASIYLTRPLVSPSDAHLPGVIDDYAVGHDGKSYFSSNAAIYVVEPDANADQKYRRLTGVQGQGGYSPDGSLAINSLVAPGQVAADEGGNVYFTEPANGRVRKILPDGTLATVAGNGQVGWSVERSSHAVDATQTAFPELMELMVDYDGTVYVQDGYSSIRKVATDGSTTVIAGSYDANAPGYSENGVANEQRFPDNGSYTRMAFNTNHQLFFIADAKIYTIDGTGAITKYAGGDYGSPMQGAGYGYDVPRLNLGIEQPTGIAFDGDNNLYYTQGLSYGGGKIVRIQASDGMARQFAGGGNQYSVAYTGTANSLSLSSPSGLYIAPDGSMNFVTNGYYGSETVIRIIAPDVFITPPILSLPSSSYDQKPSMSWNEATTSVSYYNIYRDGVKIASTTDNNYTDSLVPHGVHEYYVTAVGYGENESTPSNTAGAIYDTTGPDITISTPTVGSYVSGTVTVSGTATDEFSGIKNRQIIVKLSKIDESGNLGEPLSTIYGTVPRSGVWSVAFNSTAFSGGKYAVTAVAEDALGISGSTTLKPFTISNARPTISFTSPTSFSDTYVTAPTVTVVANDANGLSVLVIHVYNSSNQLQTIGCRANSSQLAAGTLTCNLAGLAPGTYYVRAGVTNVAGRNQTISSPMFTVTN